MVPPATSQPNCNTKPSGSQLDRPCLPRPRRACHGRDVPATAARHLSRLFYTCFNRQCETEGAALPHLADYPDLATHGLNQLLADEEA